MEIMRQSCCDPNLFKESPANAINISFQLGSIGYSIFMCHNNASGSDDRIFQIDDETATAAVDLPPNIHR